MTPNEINKAIAEACGWTELAKRITPEKAQELLLKIATQQREIVELRHQNDILRSETYSLPACEKNNAELAAEIDSLTRRLKAWKALSAQFRTAAYVSELSFAAVWLFGFIVGVICHAWIR